MATIDSRNVTVQPSASLLRNPPFQRLFISRHPCVSRSKRLIPAGKLARHSYLQ